MFNLVFTHNKIKVAVQAGADATIGDVKAALEAKTGVLPKRQKLLGMKLVMSGGGSQQQQRPGDGARSPPPPAAPRCFVLPAPAPWLRRN